MQHPHPISESESRELALDSYVMQINHQVCVACGRIERFSQVFEVWCHPTKTRTTGLRDLRPTNGQLKPLPIATVERRERQIPICLACVGSHQPTRPPAPTSNAAWAETLKRKYTPYPNPAEVKVVTKSASPTKAVPTLDQI